jgi:O-antigen ligase
LFGFSAVLTLALIGPLMTISDLPLTGEGSAPRQIAYLLSLLTLIVAVRPRHHAYRLLVIPWPLVLALVWCWLSLTWAIEPGIAVRRLVLTTVVIWSIFLAVTHLSFADSAKVSRIALVVLLVVNYIAVFGWPETAIHQFGELLDPKLTGNWRGIMMHKNNAGVTCSLTIIAFLFDAKKIPLSVRVAVIAAAGFFLFETSSRTSMAAGAAAVVVGLIYTRYDSRYRMVFIPLLILLAVGIASTLDITAAPVATQVNNSSLFTGRPLIWQMLTTYSADNRLLGSGYGSFWNIGPLSPVFQYGTGWITAIGEGHDGYLDLLVTIGVPGLLLVVFAVFLWPLYRAIKSPAATGSRGAFTIAIIIFAMVHNGTESSVFDRDTIIQVFLMIAIAMLCALTPRVRNERGWKPVARPPEPRRPLRTGFVPPPPAGSGEAAPQ